jgi:predicted enzyme related to lactoylglutathione lyase
MGMEDNGSYLTFHKKGTSVHGGFSKVASAEKLVSPKETDYVAVRVSMCVEEVGKTLEEVKKHGGEVVR